jgi:hypothetical protein
MACSTCENGSGSCGCSVPQTVQLMDESGQTHNFYITDRVNVEGQDYVLLVDSINQDQMALLRVEQDTDGKETYSNIQDEAEWERLQVSLFEAIQ